MMIRWCEQNEKGVTDGQTDGRTERSVLRAAYSQLKNNPDWVVYMYVPHIYICDVIIQQCPDFADGLVEKKTSKLGNEWVITFD